MIQRVSPLVPVIHIRNGILGSRGHIVSFFQDISSIAKVLPRLPSEVQVLKVIRENTNKSGESSTKALTVNHECVIKALKWLHQYNPLYKDIIIDESRMNWMGGKNSCQFNDSAILKGDSENNFIDDESFFLHLSFIDFFMSNEFFLFLYIYKLQRTRFKSSFPGLNVNDYVEEVYGNIAGQGGQIVNTIGHLLAIN